MSITDTQRRRLTPEEAAAFAQCSVSTLRRRIREGALPATRIGPTDRSPIRIDQVELEGWLAQNPAGAVPPALADRGDGQ